jgi:hypothetical protein
LLVFKPAQKTLIVERSTEPTHGEKLKEAWKEFNKKRGVLEWPKEKYPKL